MVGWQLGSPLVLALFLRRVFALHLLFNILALDQLLVVVHRSRLVLLVLAMRSSRFDSASVNSISSMPSPVYQ